MEDENKVNKKEGIYSNQTKDEIRVILDGDHLFGEISDEHGSEVEVYNCPHCGKDVVAADVLWKYKDGEPTPFCTLCNKEVNLIQIKR